MVSWEETLDSSEKKCKWIFSDESQFVKKDNEKAQVWHKTKAALM